MRPAGNSAESRLGLPEYRGHSFGEKFAFALLVLFILAALAGLFGDGPLSGATASSADGRLRVEYERFCRREAPQTLDVTLPTERGVDNISVQIDAEYLQRVQITEMVPAPLQTTHHETGQLTFATDGSGEPLTVRLHLKPQHSGTQQVQLAVDSAGKHSEVRFRQLVYP